jgi:hypothetical protein
MIMTLDELLEQYWNVAYAEGKEGRNQDTEDAIAQRTLIAIHAEVRRLILAGRDTQSATTKLKG